MIQEFELESGGKDYSVEVHVEWDKDTAYLTLLNAEVYVDDDWFAVTDKQTIETLLNLTERKVYETQDRAD